MKLMILFGDFGVGKSYIANLIKSLNNPDRIITINIYDFISYRIFKVVDKSILETNAYLEQLTYNKIFKNYQIKQFINSNIYDKYQNKSINEILKQFLIDIGYFINYKPKEDLYEIYHTPEFYSSDDFKSIVYNKTREFVDFLRKEDIQTNTIKYLLINDFLNFVSQGINLFDYIIYYGYSSSEFKYFNNNFKDNIIFVENETLNHINLIDDYNKINVVTSDQQRLKMDNIKNNSKFIIKNNLDFTNDLINKINIVLEFIPEIK